ncbi:putative thiazole-containing bacteriocin maturation protein [Paenibacillus ginsengarvi]|uniref:Putative thiazole-containing bacteriocin maturation protein n=1 Tax=Paenibacillus ginsengarvi TaxID=400777 RepID=A0A3B0CFG5_9BACL|nr:putative thiazole-containing bacteriocin maturation protein [Paenibacillus ginsengarvi]RKN84020.1 putative thiazole-containing bacteriocin maturation protein [Paenibacillus ginsengarvi]
MEILTPDARLKVKGDTFFMPVPGEGVYFRNNVGTFRMTGDTIDRWIERLLPMFNGENTMKQLTDGLSAPYREQVYGIAQTLLQNGFVRDVSRDRPCRLPPDVLERHGSQIAFLDSFADSGAYRFQCYRESSVLAAGSGPFLLALVSALLESGLPKLHVAITDPAGTNRKRLAELERHARVSDPEVEVKETVLPERTEEAWRERVRPFSSVLYVSADGDADELRLIQSACIAEGKLFIPATVVRHTGLAGPLVQPGSGLIWETAYRRLHLTALEKDPLQHAFSPAAGAILANVAAFEHFKTVTGAVRPELSDAVYTLDLETFEGSWHKLLPHPLVQADGRGREETAWLEDWEARLDEGTVGHDVGALFAYLNRITSKSTGILHLWEEGELLQLPLSQCRAIAADPLSPGPAELLPELVASGFTHEEARREAGLGGLEAYVSRQTAGLAGFREGGAGIGAGGSTAEAVARGLQACLSERLRRRHAAGAPVLAPVQLGEPEDDRCKFYLQALTRLRGTPVIGAGEELAGFPVVWVGTGGRWYGSAGLNGTLALRGALQGALLRVQNESRYESPHTVEAGAALVGRREPLRLEAPACEPVARPDTLRAALNVLAARGLRLEAADMAAEPALKEWPGAIVGVRLREEGAK